MSNHPIRGGYYGKYSGGLPPVFQEIVSEVGSLKNLNDPNEVNAKVDALMNKHCILEVSKIRGDKPGSVEIAMHRDTTFRRIVRWIGRHLPFVQALRVMDFTNADHQKIATNILAMCKEKIKTGTGEEKGTASVLKAFIERNYLSTSQPGAAPKGAGVPGGSGAPGAKVPGSIGGSVPPPPAMSGLPPPPLMGGLPPPPPPMGGLRPPAGGPAMSSKLLQEIQAGKQLRHPEESKADESDIAKAAAAKGAKSKEGEIPREEKIAKSTAKRQEERAQKTKEEQEAIRQEWLAKLRKRK